MRVNLKPAAASAAVAFLLLLLFSLTWPGHGIWLLAVGILVGSGAAYVWWRDHLGLDQRAQHPASGSPFSNVGAYGLSGAAIRHSRQPRSGIPLSGVLAPISALAILLFVGGVIGSAEDAPTETSSQLEEQVSPIDRSGDGEPTTPQVAPPSTRQIQQSQTSSTAVAATSSQASSSAEEGAVETQQAAAPVKPIVVAAPRAVSPADDEAEAVALVPESANTFEYIVEEGDTLYDIAERYNSTVDAIMNLNQLDATSFIHPGDVLLIPLDSNAAAGEES
ncbi:MAG: LysM peptidoglycan-binding domain-containing protein [Chloroflexi bacterium]|nr:LysM peptidoglycan-binding domain-containing protein [Chloroflexota bacterium]